MTDSGAEPHEMKIYRVGGSVRDELLGLPIHDSDWVVVGGTPEQMLKAGYRPVGKYFPVFLHPETQEEYALARTERKTGPGYKGFDVYFAPDVSLEEDLLRRDLTINAMAKDNEGNLIDPYDGQTDLQARLLRHVSPAFNEDPVRILRVARFAARFADFSVAAETKELMHDMVVAGETDALVPERIWQEVSRGLMHDAPHRMLDVLQSCDAAPIVLPLVALQGAIGDRLRNALSFAVDNKLALPARFAILALASMPETDQTDLTNPKPVQDLAAALRVPGDCRAVATSAAQTHTAIEAATSADAARLFNLIERLDGLRRPDHMQLVLQAVNAWYGGALGAVVDQLTNAQLAASQVDAGAIARPLASQGAEAISQAVAQARVAAIAAVATIGKTAS